MTTLLFDLYATGHHVPYLIQAAAAWRGRTEGGHLVIATVSRALTGGVAQFLAAAGDPRIAVVDLGAPKGLSEEVYGPRTALKNDLVHGWVLDEVLESVRPDRVILLYADHLQVSLGFSLRGPHVAHVTGLHFRPTLHYAAALGEPTPWRPTLVKRVLLRAALRNPRLDRWLTLDPYAVPTIRSLSRRVDVGRLPDGTDTSRHGQGRDEILERYGVDRNRRVALCFGELNERKGVLDVLAALPHLPGADQKNLCVLCAGSISAAERPRIVAAIEAARSGSDVRITVSDARVPDEDVQDLFHAADSVLVAYSGHTGSSGVLIRAAAAGVPVVGSNRGLLGQYIRDRRLGLAVDTHDREQLARAIAGATLRDEGLNARFDPAEAFRFASEHSVTAFGDALFGSAAGAGSPGGKGGSGSPGGAGSAGSPGSAAGSFGANPGQDEAM